MEDYFIANFLFLVPSLALCVMLYCINWFLDKLKQESGRKQEERFFDTLSYTMYLTLTSMCYKVDGFTSTCHEDKYSLKVITDIKLGKMVY